MANPNYQTITAKYKGQCAVCGESITIGSKIKYAKGFPTLHAGCEMPEIPADAVHISAGSGYGCEGWTPGEVIVNPNARATGPEYLFVLLSTSRYYSEDGLSFGVGDESGHVYSATCRHASDEESAPLRARIAEKNRQHAAETRRAALAKGIRSEGERPETADPQGGRITDRQNIYGGGDWFVLGENEIWYVLNNGRDGDDWSVNNVRTGGAGAIGWRAPLTEELANELLEIESVLDPQGAERRKPSSGGFWSRHLSGTLDAAIWGPGHSEPLAPGNRNWFDLGDGIAAAIDGQSIIVACRSHGVEECVHNQTYPTNAWGYLHGRYAVAVRYSLTPARQEALAAHTPEWLTPGFIDSMAGLRYEDKPAFPTGKTGRFRLPNHNGWAACERDAIWLCRAHGLSLGQVEFTPDVELIYSNGESRFTGKPWALWSDGRATTGECNAKGTREFSRPVSQLIGAALRQKSWTENQRWKALLEIESIESSESLSKKDRGGSNWGESWELERLTLKGSSIQTLYRVTEEGWSMGADGDAWANACIFESESEARAYFNKQGAESTTRH